MKISTRLYPFPHACSDNVLRNGSVQFLPDRCATCTIKECLSSKTIGIGLCRFGFNYERVHESFVVLGILVKEFATNSEQRIKQLKKLHELRISKEALSRANAALRDEWHREQQKTDQARSALLQNYINTQKFKNDFLKELQPEIQKGLSFVHDYKQVNAQIKQNINVIIESRYSGPDFEAKLAQCSHAEKAIYEASKFLEEKLAVTKFLMHPEWLDRATECEWSRFHGLVHKYLKIYESRCRAKKVEINLAGETFQNVWANRQALAVIPHTLIDNAVKYSPKGGRIEIIAHNLGKSIRFEVSSYGPQILPDETEKIFQPFYRGIHAEKAEEEGSGYGLYLSQLIAQRHLGASIAVRQSSTETIGMGFWTTFSIEIPERATIGRPKRDSY